MKKGAVFAGAVVAGAALNFTLTRTTAALHLSLSLLILVCGTRARLCSFTKCHPFMFIIVVAAAGWVNGDANSIRCVKSITGKM